MYSGSIWLLVAVGVGGVVSATPGGTEVGSEPASHPRGVDGHRGGSAVVLLRVERLHVLSVDPVSADADVLAVGCGGPAVVHQVVEGRSRFDLARRWCAGAAGTAGPGGAVALRFAAIEADSVPGSTWKNRKVLVGAVIAVPAVTAALIALTLVSVPNVAGFVVATTSTFHHSGAPSLRVPTTWS